MKQGFRIIAMILLLSSLVSAEENIVSFSEKIFYKGNIKEVENEIERLNSRKINFKAQTSFTLDLNEKNSFEPVRKIENILTDVKNFSTIPYYSKRHDTTYPLFKNITVLEDYTDNEGRRIIKAEQTIPPFKPADIRYIIEKKDNHILFKAENIENIRWWILPVITQHKLLILFSAEVKNGRLECYGLGTADTGSFFFMRKRLKDAFNGRTEALIRWIHSMLNEEFSK